MGFELAAALIVAGVQVAAVAAPVIITAAQSEEQRKSASKAASKQRTLTERLAKENRDRLKVTGRGIAKRNARAALVVGSPRGVLSTEDQTATSGRGTLLGN